MSIKISVLTAVYNGSHFLNEMIESIAKQTFKDFELILVNDGSQDSTLEIMQAAAQKYSFIKIVNNPTNKGVAGALNTGLPVCTGEYLFRIDADDLITPDCLEKLVNFLNDHPTYNAVICDEQKVDENLQPKYALLKLPDHYFIQKQNLFRTAYGGPTTLVKMSCVNKTTGFDEKMRAGCDRVFGLELHAHLHIGLVPECLYIYREHASNITKTLKQFKKTTIFHKTIAEKAKQIFTKEDYINDWAEVKKIKNQSVPHLEIRLKKYANTIVKCALHLAELGDRQAALAEIKKAKYLQPKLVYWPFSIAIMLGCKKSLTGLYVNMNAWTNYAYDDFMLTATTEGCSILRNNFLNYGSHGGPPLF